MLKSGEIWLSNPLFSNDYEEVAFGLNSATEQLALHVGLKSYPLLIETFQTFRNNLDRGGALTIFALCLSDFLSQAKNAGQEEDEIHDGSLAMWRGYGGDGNGVAVLFDADRLEQYLGDPFKLVKIRYLSQQERLNEVKSIFDQANQFLATQQRSDAELKQAAQALFQRILFHTLFIKHKGFREEEEWRAVLWVTDISTQRLRDRIDYHRAGDHVLPMLKLPKHPNAQINFADAIVRIVAGPGLAAGLFFGPLKLMIHKIAPPLSAKLAASRTPYRPKPRL